MNRGTRLPRFPRAACSNRAGDFDEGAAGSAGRQGADARGPRGTRPTLRWLVRRLTAQEFDRPEPVFLIAPVWVALGNPKVIGRPSDLLMTVMKCSRLTRK